MLLLLLPLLLCFPSILIFLSLQDSVFSLFFHLSLSLSYFLSCCHKWTKRKNFFAMIIEFYHEEDKKTKDRVERFPLRKKE
jgi:hypothetical protein